MTLNITEGNTIPQRAGRPKEDNPFDGKFPTKGHGTDDQKTLVVELPSGTDEEKAYVRKVVNQAHEAARNSISDEAPHGYTARVDREGFKKGNKEYTRLTIWSTERVFRPGSGRKPQETAQEG